VNVEFTEMGQLHTYQLQLQIRDDSIGLEDLENRTLSLSAISHHCYDVQFTPYGQTQVIILDDDSKMIIHTQISSYIDATMIPTLVSGHV